MTICPVCLSIERFESKDGGSWGVNNIRHECQVCGIFGTSWEARDDYLGPQITKTTTLVRATLSHWIRERQAKENRDNIPLVTDDIVQAAQSGEINLPNPAEQALNIIRFIGDKTKLSGEPLGSLSPSFHAEVGSVRREFAHDLLFELVESRKIKANDVSDSSGFDAMDVRLTLNGWELYDAERSGKVAGNYGFIALKFGDSVLDPFLQQHIKPAINSIGMELRDMRDTAQAGIIDNLMRMQIRDSAFVLVDLTHDNSGAYWEAGYAEGLGKPVLYICEKSKFNAVRTHFDTSHSTTVVWDTDKPEEFKEMLVATLKRSLVL